MTSRKRSKTQKTQIISLSFLSLLFIFRVLAQLIQYFQPISWLPYFEQWHSSTVPYELLVIVQFIIIAMQVKFLHALIAGRIEQNIKISRIVLIFGGVYFLAMVIRLVGGLTILHEVAWFRFWLPALFHIVLSLFLIGVSLVLRGSGQDNLQGADT